MPKLSTDFDMQYGNSWAAERHGQEISLRVNSLCADLLPEQLLPCIARELAEDLSLDVAAFYRIEATSQAPAHVNGNRKKEVRLIAGSPAAELHAAGDDARSMHAAVLRAARTCHAHLAPVKFAEEHDAAFVLAIPLGEQPRQTILVVRGPDQHREHIRSALVGAMSALRSAVRIDSLLHSLAIADRHNLELRTMFDHSTEAIVTVDRNFHILEANPASARLLGWSATSPVGKHCSEVLMCRDSHGQLLCRTLDCPLTCAFQDAMVGERTPYRELKWQTTLGVHKEVSATFLPIQAAGGPHGIIVARDMTPLNDADRMRAHFISMVSHELRTPTNSINGFLEIVLEGHVGPLTPRQIEFLNYARSSTQQLMTLVEDTLFISRADTGQFKLRFEPVVVPDLIAQTVQNCQAAARHANVELRTQMPDGLPLLNADELRLQQVLSNLIHNAINFTPPQGTITVRVEKWANELCFDVCDTGEGVPLDEQQRIFDRFYQAPTPRQGRSGGYGLGLAIAKLIVLLHGGRIWVTSAPPDGATFSFTMPLSKEAHTGTQEDKESAHWQD